MGGAMRVSSTTRLARVQGRSRRSRRYDSSTDRLNPVHELPGGVPLATLPVPSFSRRVRIKTLLRLTLAADSISGTITDAYDGLDRLTSGATPHGTVGYTYDAAGRRTSMAEAGQAAVSYSYDNANRLTQITQGTSSIACGGVQLYITGRPKSQNGNPGYTLSPNQCHGGIVKKYG